MDRGSLYYHAAVDPATGGCVARFALFTGQPARVYRGRGHPPGDVVTAHYLALLAGLRTAAGMGVRQIAVHGSSRETLALLEQRREDVAGEREGAAWPFDAACWEAAGGARCTYVSIYAENNEAVV